VGTISAPPARPNPSIRKESIGFAAFVALVDYCVARGSCQDRQEPDISALYPPDPNNGKRRTSHCAALRLELLEPPEPTFLLRKAAGIEYEH
jgi:hypothetical protein